MQYLFVSFIQQIVNSTNINNIYDTFSNKRLMLGMVLTNDINHIYDTCLPTNIYGIWKFVQ